MLRKLGGLQLSKKSASVGLRVPLRTGGTFRVSLPIAETDTNNPFATVNPAYTADVNFSISQPLLRNAGRPAACRVAVDVAEAGPRGSRAQELRLKQLGARVERLLLG